MKHFYVLLAGIVLLAFGCTKDETIAVLSMQENAPKSRVYLENDNPFVFNDSTLILGKRLMNPYSVTNMNIARDSLIAEGASPSSVPTIKITHNYVRFKPADEEALLKLKLLDTTIAYYEYPLDYEIVENGVSYHDPDIPDTLPTYQYAAIPLYNWLNMQDSLNIEYTIIENLCILDDTSTNNDFEIQPNLNHNDSLIFKSINLTSNNSLNNCLDNDTNNSYDESIISALMTKSFALTGNGDYEDMSLTRASNRWRPSGTIRAYDNIVDDYIPLEGVIVRARRWFTTHKGITDNEGKFSCNGTFKNPANYSIIWGNITYSIRDGNFIQAYYNGPKKKGEWNLDINSGKSLRYATIHRAAYRMFYKNIHDLKRPFEGLGFIVHTPIAYLHKNNNGTAGIYYTPIPTILTCGLWPTIRIFGSVNSIWQEMSEIFSTTSHELGHAAHFTHSDKFILSTNQHRESWATFVEYYLTKLEYIELGAIDKLLPKHTLPNDSNSREWSIPNIYNRQYWNTKEYDNTYTPLYIDIIDDTNQQEYERIIGINPYQYYPYDEVHFLLYPLQLYVFQSTSIKGVKKCLLDYANSNEYVANHLFGVSTEKINKLFEYYEKQ